MASATVGKPAVGHIGISMDPRARSHQPIACIDSVWDIYHAWLCPVDQGTRFGPLVRHMAVMQEAFSLVSCCRGLAHRARELRWSYAYCLNRFRELHPEAVDWAYRYGTCRGISDPQMLDRVSERHMLPGEVGPWRLRLATATSLAFGSYMQPPQSNTPAGWSRTPLRIGMAASRPR